ncbi:MAG: hypothetical protein IJS39_00265 [Synergistaceae bacterium]|nr:hypothetical protein [Synergistaceae bacterium]
MKLTLIAEKLSTTFSGSPDHEITRIAPPQSADTSSLCVIWDKKALEILPTNIPIAAPKEFFTPSRIGLISQNLSCSTGDDKIGIRGTWHL